MTTSAATIEIGSRPSETKTLEGSNAREICGKGIGGAAIIGAMELADRELTFVKIIKTSQSLPYQKGYQPEYDDLDQLLRAMEELDSMTDLGATPESVYKNREMYAARVTGNMTGAIWIVNGCSTPVILAEDKSQGVAGVVDEKTATIDRVLKVIGPNGRVSDRSCTEKPRTDAVKKGVITFRGGAVNREAEDAASRRPDPTNLVAATIQDREVQSVIKSKYDGQVMSSQEILILPRAYALMRKMENGKVISLQTEMPWVGVRTSDPEGDHIDALSMMDNTVGVKIDHNTTPEDIKRYHERLNSNNEPGKEAYIFRLGPKHRNKLGPLLDSVKNNAPGAAIIGDLVHGITITLPSGEKTRVATDAIDEGLSLIDACEERGLICAGFMLETIGNETDRECVMTHSESPTHTSKVDPGFNLNQTEAIVTVLHKKIMEVAKDKKCTVQN